MKQKKHQSAEGQRDVETGEQEVFAYTTAAPCKDADETE
jgi:hypothetical protein